MGLQEISDIKEGYNERFGREPQEAEDSHRSLRRSDDLEKLFTRKETWKLSKNLTFQYQGSLYQIQTNAPNRIRKMYVEVLKRAGEAVILKVECRMRNGKKKRIENTKSWIARMLEDREEGKSNQE